MIRAEQSSYLVPTGTFVVLCVCALLLSLLVVWPLVGAAVRRQWAWVALIVVFGPFAGALWFFMGRNDQTVPWNSSTRPSAR